MGRVDWSSGATTPQAPAPRAVPSGRINWGGTTAAAAPVHVTSPQQQKLLNSFSSLDPRSRMATLSHLQSTGQHDTYALLSGHTKDSYDTSKDDFTPKYSTADKVGNAFGSARNAVSEGLLSGAKNFVQGARQQLNGKARLGSAKNSLGAAGLLLQTTSPEHNTAGGYDELHTKGHTVVPGAGKLQSNGELAKDTAISGAESLAGVKILKGVKAGIDIARTAKGAEQATAGARINLLNRHIEAAPKEQLQLPAGKTAVVPKGLPDTTSVPYKSNKLPGGGVMVDEGSNASKVVANANKPTKIQTSPGKPGQNISDLTSPRTTKAQVVQAGRTIADGEKNPNVRLNDKQATKTNLNESMQKWAKFRNGENSGNATPGKAAHIQTLNDIIEHPDAAPHVKEQAIHDRNEILRNGTKDQLAQDHSAQTGQPLAASHETLSNGNGDHGPLYQAVNKPAPRIAHDLSPDFAKAEKAQKVVKEAETLAEPKTAKNSPVQALYNKLVNKTKVSGIVNPRQAAARNGNLDLAEAGHAHVVETNLNAHDAGVDAAKFDELRKAENLSHDDIIKMVESGNTSGSKAATLFKNLLEQAGKEGKDAGSQSKLRENYVPRIGKVEDPSHAPAEATGLSKNHRFNNAREETPILGKDGKPLLDENNQPITEDKYKTHGEFVKAIEAAGGHVETDTRKILEHTLRTERNAATNATTIKTLEKTPMHDGRPAVVTAKRAEEKAFRDYRSTTALPGRYVHPEAHRLIEAIGRNSQFDNEIAQGISKVNSFGKRLVTVNGVVHAKNFMLAGFRNQGVIRTLTSPFRNYSEEDVRRAISNGFQPSKISQSNIFDEIGKPSSRFGKVGEVLGNVRHTTDKLLFEHLGDSVGMSTYKHIESSLTKKLGADEAGKVAAEFANQTIFTIPKDEQSIAARHASQLALFAGKYFQNTMKIGTQSFGLGLDKTLSSGAQTAQQQIAIKSAVRGFTGLFLTAQAINYRATGKFTWQNNNSSALSPVFYVDKSTGKQYHITNFYGQLGEFIKLFNNPAHELTNKLAPGLKEIGNQMANHDEYTGKDIADKTTSGAQQTIDRMIHAANGLFTPLGFQASNANKVAGGLRDPAIVTTAKVFGYGSSSNNKSPFQTNIYNEYTKTLPAGTSPTKDQLQTSKDEQKARQDVKNGLTSSPNLDKVKTALGDSKYKLFLKGAPLDDTQRQFDKLPTATKLQIIEKSSSKDLQTLNFQTLTKDMLTNKSSISALQLKGVTPETIRNDLKKVGVTSDQYSSLTAQFKKDASASAKASRLQAKKAGKYHNPVTGN